MVFFWWNPNGFGKSAKVVAIPRVPRCPSMPKMSCSSCSSCSVFASVVSLADHACSAKRRFAASAFWAGTFNHKHNNIQKHSKTFKDTPDKVRGHSWKCECCGCFAWFALLVSSFFICFLSKMYANVGASLLRIWNPRHVATRCESHQGASLRDRTGYDMRFKTLQEISSSAMDWTNWTNDYQWFSMIFNDYQWLSMIINDWDVETVSRHEWIKMVSS